MSTPTERTTPTPLPRFEVDVTFIVDAVNADAAWQQVYEALVQADDADGGRKAGRLPMWEMLAECATEVAR